MGIKRASIRAWPYVEGCGGIWCSWRRKLRKSVRHTGQGSWTRWERDEHSFLLMRGVFVVSRLEHLFERPLSPARLYACKCLLSQVGLHVLQKGLIDLAQYRWHWNL